MDAICKSCKFQQHDGKCGKFGENPVMEKGLPCSWSQPKEIPEKTPDRLSTVQYQIYAMDLNGKLNHCGVHTFMGEVTVQKCLDLERDWERWREDFLAENPGRYPLREKRKQTVRYTMHVAGPRKTPIFVVNLT